MTPLRCACLVAQRDDKLLLVRIRQNEHLYLPGGKIENNEIPEETLQRELAEELGILICQDSIQYLYTVIGPAYGQDGEVELICFAAKWDNEPHPNGEVTEVQWLHWKDSEKFAPVIQDLCKQYFYD